MKTPVTEYDVIRRLAAGFPRPAAQRNRLGESDAELITLPDGSLLAVTTDSISEEITTGLYDPFLAGWMSVMANCSDLAAVGARPLALLVAETFDRGWSEDQKAALQRGIAAAAHQCGIGIAGGDVNFSDRTAITGTALGICGSEGTLTRHGAKSGHTLYVSDTCGLGSAFAAAMLLDSGDVGFRPRAALREGQLLAGRASACMDSSDGLFPTLDELMRVNDCGFLLDRDPREYMHPMAIAAADALQLPAWAMLCGPHGDFNLVFTIPPEGIEAFEHCAAASGWSAQRIGRVIRPRRLECSWDDAPFSCAIDAFRSTVLAATDAGDILSSLHRFCHSQMKGVPS